MKIPTLLPYQFITSISIVCKQSTQLRSNLNMLHTGCSDHNDFLPKHVVQAGKLFMHLHCLDPVWPLYYTEPNQG